MAGTPKPRRAVITAVIYLSLVAFALLLDRPTDLTRFIYQLFNKSGDCKGREETTLQSDAIPYKLMANQYAPLSPLQVKIVTLEKGFEPSIIFGKEDALCRQRIFLARLIERLQKLGAKSIVIDKYFGQDTCTKLPAGPQNGTDQLKKAMANTSIPITLAIHTTDVGGLAGKSREIKTCLVLAQTMQFGNGKCVGKTKCVKEGAIRTDSDTRRIPIKWQVFESERDALQNGALSILPTLSLVAAEQVSPAGNAGSRLAELLGSRDPIHPFMSLREIPQFHARQVLCGVDFPENAGSNWEHVCKEPPIRPLVEDRVGGKLTDGDIAREIFGQTVVIGELTDEDVHHTVSGDIPGVVLQANYIQALLEGRYFPALPEWISFLSYAVCFGLTFVLFSRKTPGIAYLLSLIPLVALTLGSFLVIKYVGRIFPLGTETIISLIAIPGVHWAFAKGHKA